MSNPRALQADTTLPLSTLLLSDSSGEELHILVLPCPPGAPLCQLIPGGGVGPPPYHALKTPVTGGTSVNFANKASYQFLQGKSLKNSYSSLLGGPSSSISSRREVKNATSLLKLSWKSRRKKNITKHHSAYHELTQTSLSKAHEMHRGLEQ